jgi:predicted site-specific integrase-resolvase
MTLLAPRDVGRRLQLSTSRVVQLDREGRLRALRDSAGRRFYLADDVECFARERERQAAERGASGHVARGSGSTGA